MGKEKTFNNLGTEKISKLMLKFSIPCVLSLLVGSLYNIVDQIFIGNSELSALGNAATGVVFPVFIIAQAFAWCFGDGCAAYLGICQGKGDTKSAAGAIGGGIVFTLISSFALMAVFYPLGESALRLFGASDKSIGYALEYLDVVLFAIPLYMVANMMNGVIRADGSPAWAMISIIAGAVVNVILDPVFIFGTRWGMFGAALATAIGQAVSFIISAAYFFRPKTFKLTPSCFIPSIKTLRGAILLGASTFVTQLTIVVISVLCNILLSKYGVASGIGADVPIAIIGIEGKVFTVVINLVVGIALGCQPIISYNMGAKNYGRVKELFRKIMLCTVVIGAVSTLLFELLPGAVVGMFGAPTNIPNPEDYWEFGEKFFRIFLSLVTFTCIVKAISIFFQAAGKPIRAVASSLVRDIFCFVPFVLIFPAVFGGIDGILYAGPAADIFAMIVALVLVVSFFKSLKKSDSEESFEEAVLKPSRKGVIITIAREHGSAGKQIGKVLAQRMGIPFYYKELAALAAKESGLDREFLTDINTNSPAHLHTLYLSTDVIRQAVVAQNKVIRRIAEEGSCVIVGRAADYVLRDYSDLVRIFIYAPEDYKIKRVMELYGDSAEDAKKNVRRSDEVRASYYKNISERTWGDRRNYELMVDGSVGIEASVDIICAYLEGRGEQAST